MYKITRKVGLLQRPVTPDYCSCISKLQILFVKNKTFLLNFDSKDFIELRNYDLNIGKRKKIVVKIPLACAKG